jgi:hypothetical protein
VAATLTNANELTYLSFPITKFEKNEDGDLVVYGKATDGSVDSDEQIVDSDFSTKAIQDWLASGGNVRVQHNSQRDPAGIGIEANSDADGATWVKSLVIEPVAQRLVEKGALRAYSVGIARPKIVRDAVARGGRIVDGQIVEISLVDRPANKNCGIQLVKSAGDGTPEWSGELWGIEDETPKMITKSVTKTTTTTYEMPADVSDAFSPADMAKLLGIKKDLEADVEKRDMDPDVGGGTDRDKIPAADFAGKDRSFPIVTPKDVTDAARSIGRTGDDNYSSDQLKSNIIRIAKRKGPSFVAALPDSWKEDMNTKSMSSDAAAGADDDEQGQDNTPTSDMTGNSGTSQTDSDSQNDDDDDASKAAKPKKGGKKPFPGAAPAFDATDSDGDGADADKPGSEADDDGSEAKVKPGSSKKEAEEPEVAKAGAKACPNCGKNYHADTKLKRCENCNTKLPKANKGVGAKVTEIFGVDVSSLDPEAAKALTLAIIEKYGPGTVKPTPDDGAVGAASIAAVPAHREPDGPAIEALEHDMHIPTNPDGPYELEMKAAQRIKRAGAPYDLGALHDLTCPGFHPVDAMKCHPSVNLAGLDLGYWSSKAENAVYGSSFEDARIAADQLRFATAAKGLDPETYFGAAIEAHKAFRDANPGPASFPNPTAIKPGSFNRPVMTAGHSKPGMDYDGPNVHSVPAGSISAAQYDRGYLDAGHAAASPGNMKSEGIVPAPVPTGAAQRTFYTNATRDNARQAMAVLHDHIAQTFPDLCPMGAGGAFSDAPAASRPVPSPVGAVKAEEPKAVAPVEAQAVKQVNPNKILKKVRKGLMTIDEARQLLGAAEPSPVAQAEVPVEVAKSENSPEVAKAATVDVDIIKSAMAEVTGGLLAKLTEMETVLKAERDRSAKLEKAVEEMSAMADPRVQPYNAASIAPPVLKSASPVGWSVAESAERTQAALMQALLSDARTDSDPSVRERAWAKLYEMNGI